MLTYAQNAAFFKFFAERHLLAMLITLMTIFLGLSTFRGIKRDMFPEVDFGEMFIRTRHPGASPEDVELNVTNKIEEELQEVIAAILKRVGRKLRIVQECPDGKKPLAGRAAKTG